MRGSSGRTASAARVDTKTSSDAAALPEAVAGLVGAAVLFGAGDDFQSGIVGPTSIHHIFVPFSTSEIAVERQGNVGIF